MFLAPCPQFHFDLRAPSTSSGAPAGPSGRADPSTTGARARSAAVGAAAAASEGVGSGRMYRRLLLVRGYNGRTGPSNRVRVLGGRVPGGVAQLSGCDPS
jgi:hypothetical protein